MEKSSTFSRSSLPAAQESLMRVMIVDSMISDFLSFKMGHFLS